MKKPFVLIICLFCILLTGCGKSAKDYISSGYAYLDEGKYEEAIIEFTNAIEIDEKNIEALFGRVKAYSGNKSYTEAINDCTAITEIDPNYDGIYDMRGDLYYQTGEYDQAISDYRIAVDRDSTNTDVLDKVIGIAINENDISTAQEFILLKKTNDESSLSNEEKDILSGMDTINQLVAVCAQNNGTENDLETIVACLQNETLFSVIKTMGSPLFIEQGGKTLGLYIPDGFNIVNAYYGDIKDGVRSGKGSWYVAEGNVVVTASGDWANDKPNGMFEQQVSYSPMKASGIVKDGLWDGDVEITGPLNNGGTLTMHGTFTNGIVTPKAFPYADIIVADYAIEGGGVYLVEIHRPEATYGIVGFSEAYL